MTTEDLRLESSANQYGVISLVLSILFVVIGPLGSVPGIIFGNKALSKYKSLGITQGKGIATAGVVIGWVGIFLFIILLIIGVAANLMLNEIYDQVLDLDV